MILELHRIATYQAIENNAVSGQFRQDRNLYYGLQWRNSSSTAALSKFASINAGLCDFANTNHNGEQAIFIHPVIKAIMLHFLLGIFILSVMAMEQREHYFIGLC